MLDGMYVRMYVYMYVCIWRVCVCVCVCVCCARAGIDAAVDARRPLFVYVCVCTVDELDNFDLSYPDQCMSTSGNVFSDVLAQNL